MRTRVWLAGFVVVSVAGGAVAAPKPIDAATKIRLPGKIAKTTITLAKQ